MLVLLVVVASSLWVFFDAKSIGVRKGLVSGLLDLGPGGWCGVTALMWLVCFPLYLYKRGSLKAAAVASGEMRASPSAKATSDDSIVSLEKLANLRDRGVLTQIEFDQKKRQLLGG